jgi:hypothetical protein
MASSAIAAGYLDSYEMAARMVAELVSPPARILSTSQLTVWLPAETYPFVCWENLLYMFTMDGS